MSVRYTKGIEHLTRLSVENNWTLPSSAYKPLKSLGDENDEPIYCHNNEYLRYSLRKNKNGRICTVFNQNYKVINFEELFIIISTELKINGSVCEILDKCFQPMTYEPTKINFRKRIWFAIWRLQRFQSGK